MIQTRQIEAFRAVMLTGAMTTAAEMIRVSQPAVSRLVRDLEHQLGLTLFRRRGNLVVPTPEATALLTEWNDPSSVWRRSVLLRTTFAVAEPDR